MKKIKNLISFLILMLLFITVSSCGGGSDAGDETIFVPKVVVVIDPPSASTLSTPKNNKVCVDGSSISETQSSVSFQWNAATNADSYDLMITNLNSNQLITQNNINGTSKSVTLNKGTPYSWKIVSKRNGTTKTSTSDTWKFYLSGEGIKNYPPYPANLLSPKSGSRLPSSTTSVELSWEGSDPDGEVIKHTVYIDTIDGFQTPESENKNLTSSSKSITVTSGTTYYWRIKLTDPNENSSYSLVYTFLIE